MSERKIKRALISVYDKTGIVDFARALVDEFGVEIISTGGTAKHLKEGGIPVTLVEDITGFPEMLDGRVKTLHPKIHAAILADRDNPEHMQQLKEQGIEPIDMVVVNLYPFEKTVADPNCTFEQAIEMIDIGGPCLLRAAAKNHKHVLAAHDPRAYASVLMALRDDTGWDFHAIEALESFKSVTRYDGEIVTWLSLTNQEANSLPAKFIEVNSWGNLRYGENPHQRGELLQKYIDDSVFDLTVADAQNESSVEMSFNNYMDADSALALCDDLSRGLRDRPTCVFVKHTNPCGASSADDRLEAYRKAYLADPNAAMGGILACNFVIDAEFASAVMDTYSKWGREAGAGGFFVEVWIAPGFAEGASELIRTSKPWGERVRLLSLHEMTYPPDSDELEYKSITGGMLVQERDIIGLNEDQWKVATKRAPSESEISDLKLAWLVAKHTKSNAISVCKDGMLIGNGAGQMSRVMSCRIATWLANENGHADKLKGAVAASDAFFPFPDGPNILMDAGVTAIIQPGGSKNDDKTIAACDARGVAMIFTGTRHFKH